ncbi:MAG: sulfotransferase family 2 domain-containing protein [Methylococcaceae bacterium]
MKFTLATCVRNEGPYLLEWVAHYKRLGFDRIVIFSNDNDDGSDELLSAMQDIGLIEWRPRKLEPGTSPQLSAFRAYSKRLLADPDEQGGYLAWFDCDEYLILKQHTSIKELLNFYHFPDSLYINWKHFGSAGIKEFSPELTISRFIACDSTTKHNKQCKCIARIDSALFSHITNHRPVPVKRDEWGRIVYAANVSDGKTVESAFIYGSNLKKNDESPIFHDICQLNHYAVRSEEEYSWKKSRGNGMRALDDEKVHFFKSYFADHDLNSELDSFAPDKYAIAIKEYISSLPAYLIALNEKTINLVVKNYRAGFIPNTIPTSRAPAVVNTKLDNPFYGWLAKQELSRVSRGYSAEELRKRIAYGSFVGNRMNYIFMETPKAACSSLKWILAELEERKITSKHQGHETAASMVIHDRSSHNIKNLIQVEESTRNQLLTDNNIVRFCVVRNPYARIVSAWADKIRQQEPNFKSVWINVANHFGTDPNECPSFPQFVQWIVEKQQPNRCNPHWRSMVYLLLPELFNYTHIIHTENIELELQAVFDKISPEMNASNLLEKHRINESLPVNWKDFYDEETAKRVALFYKEDFEYYDYPLDSWQRTQRNTSIDEQLNTLKQNYEKLELAALKAIRARNEVIFELSKKHEPIKKPVAQIQNVLVLGDSHTKVFGHPEWKNLAPKLPIQVISVEGATLSGLENPNSKTQAGAVFQQALLQYPANIILLCLGEVDTGFVIWLRAENNEITVKQATKRAINNYCRLITEASKKATVVVISTPLPTLTDNDKDGVVAKARAEISATQKQRTELTCEFNLEMQQWCTANNICYINIDPLSKGADGLVDAALLHNNPKNHHYNPNRYRKLLMKNVLPVLLNLAKVKT